jgi:hypothetical protein
VILDFLNEKLKWRAHKDYSMDEVKRIKQECLDNPARKLWDATKGMHGVRNIFDHLQGLKYADVPDYGLIRNQLRNIASAHCSLPFQVSTSKIPQATASQQSGQEKWIEYLPSSNLVENPCGLLAPVPSLAPHLIQHETLRELDFKGTPPSGFERPKQSKKRKASTPRNKRNAKMSEKLAQRAVKLEIVNDVPPIDIADAIHQEMLKAFGPLGPAAVPDSKIFEAQEESKEAPK